MAEQENQEVVREDHALALFYERAGVGFLKNCKLPTFDNQSVRIKTLYSGISRGTESLVFNGLIPKSEWPTMRCPHQAGDFSFPLSYGYSVVGKVIKVGSEITKLFPGDTVFVLHPHQEQIVAHGEMVRLVPKNVPSRRAVLAANMETALNGIWDGGIKAHQSVSVIGGGVVGLLTAYLANKTTDAIVTLIDINPAKREIAERLGLIFAMPDEAPVEQDVIFNTSSSEAGLQCGLDHLAFEGRLVEMSWYGSKPVNLSLGGRFHSNRLQIISSQVGHISPAKRETHGYADRMSEAMQWLADPVLDHLLEPEIAFKALPDQLPRIFAGDSDVLCQLVSYGD